MSLGARRAVQLPLQDLEVLGRAKSRVARVYQCPVVKSWLCQAGTAPPRVAKGPMCRCEVLEMPGRERLLPCVARRAGVCEVLEMPGREWLLPCVARWASVCEVLEAPGRVCKVLAAPGRDCPPYVLHAARLGSLCEVRANPGREWLPPVCSLARSLGPCL
jgi:hypothetical protein